MAAHATTINPSPFTTTHRLAIGAGFTPIVGDFDCDGRSDVFWYRPGLGTDVVWYGQAQATQFGQTQLEFPVNGNYRPVVGDFDGDGCSDIMWLDGGTGFFYIWFGNAQRTFTQYDYGGGLPGQPEGLMQYRNAMTAKGTFDVIGDYNGDGADDILVYSPNGYHADLEGSSNRSQVFNTVVAAPLVRYAYVPIATDRRGTGFTDIYWSATEFPGHDSIWQQSAGPVFHSWNEGDIPNIPPTSFTGDFNGDGKGDYFLYEPGPYAERIWYGLASSNPSSNQSLTPTTNVFGTYTPVVGDFNGDGRSDIIWYTGNGAPSPYWVAL